MKVSPGNIFLSGDDRVDQSQLDSNILNPIFDFKPFLHLSTDKNYGKIMTAADEAEKSSSYRIHI